MRFRQFLAHRLCGTVTASSILPLLAVGLLLLTKQAASVPHRTDQKPPESSSSSVREPIANPLLPVFRLDVGLAGPPVVADDGTWWLSGRDGELARLSPNDTPVWSISLGAAITGDAAIDDHGLLYVPTVPGLICAVEPNATVRWRSRVPWGIDGPLAWVPQQGLVFVARDHCLYWLGQSANILQRIPLRGQRTAGPIRVGRLAAVGSDTGEIFLCSSRGNRLRADLGQRILAISDWTDSVLALAGNRAFTVDGNAEIRWVRNEVAAIGVATGKTASDQKGSAVILGKMGQVDWLDHEGNVTASLDTSPMPADDLVPELVATNRCAWISSNSGAIWQFCMNLGVQKFQLTQLPLMRPVLDVTNGRVLVASTQGELWTLTLPPDANL